MASRDLSPLESLGGLTPRSERLLLPADATPDGTPQSSPSSTFIDDERDNIEPMTDLLDQTTRSGDFTARSSNNSRGASAMAPAGAEGSMADSTSIRRALAEVPVHSSFDLNDTLDSSSGNDSARAPASRIESVGGLESLLRQNSLSVLAARQHRRGGDRVVASNVPPRSGVIVLPNTALDGSGGSIEPILVALDIAAEGGSSDADCSGMLDLLIEEALSEEGSERLHKRKAEERVGKLMTRFPDRVSRFLVNCARSNGDRFGFPQLAVDELLEALSRSPPLVGYCAEVAIAIVESAGDSLSPSLTGSLVNIATAALGPATETPKPRTLRTVRQQLDDGLAILAALVLHERCWSTLVPTTQLIAALIELLGSPSSHQSSTAAEILASMPPGTFLREALSKRADQIAFVLGLSASAVPIAIAEMLSFVLKGVQNPSTDPLGPQLQPGSTLRTALSRTATERVDSQAHGDERLRTSFIMLIMNIATMTQQATVSEVVCAATLADSQTVSAEETLKALTTLQVLVTYRGGWAKAAVEARELAWDCQIAVVLVHSCQRLSRVDTNESRSVITTSARALKELAEAPIEDGCFDGVDAASLFDLIVSPSTQARTRDVLMEALTIATRTAPDFSAKLIGGAKPRQLVDFVLQSSRPDSTDVVLSICNLLTVSKATPPPELVLVLARTLTVFSERPSPAPLLAFISRHAQQSAEVCAELRAKGLLGLVVVFAGSGKWTVGVLARLAHLMAVLVTDDQILSLKGNHIVYMMLDATRTDGGSAMLGEEEAAQVEDLRARLQAEVDAELEADAKKRELLGLMNVNLETARGDLQAAKAAKQLAEASAEKNGAALSAAEKRLEEVDAERIATAQAATAARNEASMSALALLEAQQRAVLLELAMLETLSLQAARGSTLLRAVSEEAKMREASLSDELRAVVAAATSAADAQAAGAAAAAATAEVEARFTAHVGCILTSQRADLETYEQSERDALAEAALAALDILADAAHQGSRLLSRAAEAATSDRAASASKLAELEAVSQGAAAAITDLQRELHEARDAHQLLTASTDAKIFALDAEAARLRALLADAAAVADTLRAENSAVALRSEQRAAEAEAAATLARQHLAVAQEALDAARSRAEAAGAEVVALHRRIEELHSERTTAVQRAAEDASAQHRELRRRADDAENRAAAAKTRAAELEDQLLNARGTRNGEVEALQRAVEAHEQHATELHARLETERQQAATLREAHAHLLRDHSTVESQLRDAQERIAALEAEAVEQRAGAKRDLAEQRRSFEEKLALLTHRAAAEQAQQSALAGDQRRTAIKVGADLAALRETHSRLQQAHMTLQAEAAANAAASAVAVEKLSQEKAAVVAELREANASAAAARVEAERAHAAVIAAMKAEHEAALTELQRLAADAAAIAAERLEEARTRHVADLKALTSERDALRTELQARPTSLRVDELKSALKEALETRDTALRAQAALVRQLNEVEAEVPGLRSRIEEFGHRNAALEAAADELEVARAAGGDEATAQRRRADRLDAELQRVTLKLIASEEARRLATLELRRRDAADEFARLAALPAAVAADESQRRAIVAVDPEAARMIATGGDEAPPGCARNSPGANQRALRRKLLQRVTEGRQMHLVPSRDAKDRYILDLLTAVHALRKDAATALVKHPVVEHGAAGNHEQMQQQQLHEWARDRAAVVDAFRAALESQRVAMEGEINTLRVRVEQLQDALGAASAKKRDDRALTPSSGAGADDGVVVVRPKLVFRDPCAPTSPPPHAQQHRRAGEAPSTPGRRLRTARHQVSLERAAKEAWSESSTYDGHSRVAAAEYRAPRVAAAAAGSSFDITAAMTALTPVPEPGSQHDDAIPAAADPSRPFVVPVVPRTGSALVYDAKRDPHLKQFFRQRAQSASSRPRSARPV